jgi:hypothetical protein
MFKKIKTTTIFTNKNELKNRTLTLIITPKHLPLKIHFSLFSQLFKNIFVVFKRVNFNYAYI